MKTFTTLFFVLCMQINLFADISYQVDFSEPQIRSTSNVESVEQKGCVFWIANCQFPSCRLGKSNGAFIQVNFKKSDEIKGTPYLFLIHSTFAQRAPVKIFINGERLFEENTGGSTGKNINSCNLSKHLIDGENVITFISEPGYHDYYLQKLSVIFVDPDSIDEELGLTKEYPQGDYYEKSWWQTKEMYRRIVGY